MNDRAIARSASSGLTRHERLERIREFTKDEVGASSVVSARHQLVGHTDQVWSAAFSPDGRLLATGDRDGMARLWDPETGRPMGDPLICSYAAGLWDMVFSPDGRLLATSDPGDGGTTLWEPTIGRMVDHLPSRWIGAFSPDGGLLATMGPDRTVRLWDRTTGVLAGPLIGHTDGVASVAFSPDGRLLAMGCESGMVRLWDRATGVLGDPLIGHTDDVVYVAFSPVGRLLAAGSDMAVSLWDLATRRLASGPLDSGLGAGGEVTFSPDGRLLVVDGDDDLVLWDLNTRRMVGNDALAEAWRVAFSPDGRLVAQYETAARLWDPTTWLMVGDISDIEYVFTAPFSPDGRLLAIRDSYETVRLWEVRDQAATGALGDRAHSEPLRALGTH